MSGGWVGAHPPRPRGTGAQLLRRKHNFHSTLAPCLLFFSVPSAAIFAACSCLQGTPWIAWRRETLWARRQRPCWNAWTAGRWRRRWPRQRPRPRRGREGPFCEQRGGKTDLVGQRGSRPCQQAYCTAFLLQSLEPPRLQPCVPSARAALTTPLNAAWASKCTLLPSISATNLSVQLRINRVIQ